MRQRDETEREPERSGEIEREIGELRGNPEKTRNPWRSGERKT
jgi:hypothetical protein